jgi:methyl-accepting chemotaxis protein
MKFAVSLKSRLLLLCIGLVAVPVATVGFFGLQQLRAFSSETITQSYSGLEKEALANLLNGVRVDRAAVKGVIERAESNVEDLAGSSALIGYVDTLEGRNPVALTMVEKGMAGAVEGVVEMCRVQHEFLQKKLEGDHAVTGHMLAGYGNLSLSASKSDWTATNQFTQEDQVISLPVLQAGNAQFDFTHSQDDFVPVLDEVQKLVGGTSTVFQRMNENGDMLRVATTVRKADGKRGAGTFIPAVNPDGKANPVISTILQGETYRGRAFVIDAWYITIYKPIYDAKGNLVGMLYNGVKEQDGKTLNNAVLNTRIGQTGYTFVMDSQGKIVLHPRSSLQGSSAAAALELSDLQQVLSRKEADKCMAFTYDAGGRKRILSYYFFPEWNWIICGVGFWDELAHDVAQSSLATFKEETASLYNNSVLDAAGAGDHLYSRILFVDKERNEVLNLTSGRFMTDPEVKSNEPWLDECLRLKKGEEYNSGVVIAPRTGKPEMIVGAPVISEGELRGVMVLSVDWQVVWGLLKGHIYGETGYPFVINDSGVLVSHPKFDLTKPVSLNDPKNGELADIVMNHVLKGEEGTGKYTFEGVEKYAAYAPIEVGGRVYGVCASCPTGEFLALANNIKENAGKKSSKSAQMIGIACLTMALFGALAGLWFSVSISRPLSKIIDGLSQATEMVAQSSGKISSSSLELAEGASEQAAAIEQTSSSLNEISSMIRHNAENTNQANNSMVETSRVVEEAKASMEELTVSMKEIIGASEETQKIIKTVDEIAFQTNLLALNAAVEAARAGEAGAGFAVVADEVRSLAMRAAQAAKNTADLVEKTINTVRAGSDMVAKATGAFEKAALGTKHVSDLVGEIAAASSEQAQGIEQLNKAVSEMDHVIQQNAANAEKSAAASGALNDQAEQMEVFVSGLLTLVEGAGSSVDAAQKPGGAGSCKRALIAPQKALPGAGDVVADLEDIQDES